MIISQIRLSSDKHAHEIVGRCSEMWGRVYVRVCERACECAREQGVESTWKKLKWKPTQTLSCKQWEGERPDERVNEWGHVHSTVNKLESDVESGRPYPHVCAQTRAQRSERLRVWKMRKKGSWIRCVISTLTQEPESFALSCTVSNWLDYDISGLTQPGGVVASDEQLPPKSLNSFNRQQLIQGESS